MEELMNLKFTSDVWYILIPLILCVLDVITGYLNAWINDDVKSAKMRSGLGKKTGELVYVTLGVISKYATGINSIMVFLTLYISFMEIVSLFENCAKLGVPMPDVIKDKLNNENKEGK